MNSHFNVIVFFMFHNLAELKSMICWCEYRIVLFYAHQDHSGQRIEMLKFDTNLLDLTDLAMHIHCSVCIVDLDFG